MNLVLFGPPGSGKGTQSQFLVKKFDMLYVSTGDIARKEIEDETFHKLRENYLESAKSLNDYIEKKMEEIDE